MTMFETLYYNLLRMLEPFVTVTAEYHSATKYVLHVKAGKERFAVVLEKL